METPETAPRTQVEATKFGAAVLPLISTAVIMFISKHKEQPLSLSQLNQPLFTHRRAGMSVVSMAETCSQKKCNGHKLEPFILTMTL